MENELYAPMPGGRLSQSQAAIVGKELDSIAEREGCATAALVVEESTPEDAPLHNYFTWDESDAACRWRLEEASRLIRSVRVVQIGLPQNEQLTVRAFVSVRAHDTETQFSGQAYIQMRRVMASKQYRQQVLDAAKNELVQWQRRYADYRKYFSSVFDAIEAAK